MAEQWTVKSVDGEEPKSAQEVEQAVVEEAAAESPNVEIENNDDVIRVNLDAPPQPKEEATEEDSSEEVPEEAIEEVLSEEPTQEVVQEVAEEEAPVLELIQDEESNSDEGGVEQQPEAAAAPQEQEEVPQAQPEVQLPEGVESLVKFMEETGGTVEDYLNLNKDYDQIDDVSLIREYYKQKYPNYNDERIDRKMNKEFMYNEDVDDQDAIQDKRDSFEDTVYEAKRFLNEKKDKYYDELKFNRDKNVPTQYQEAVETANYYKQAEESNKKLQEKFAAATDNVFNSEFKGFDFKVGDNKYRYKVNDPQKTKAYQSDLNNFISEFTGEDGTINDASGYHKAMYAAKNADKIAQHFYEQGRADALKRSAKEAKNIDMNPKQDMTSVVTSGGTKVRVVQNNDFGSKLKFKNYNNS